MHLDAAPAYPAQHCGGMGILCHHHGAGGVPVQTVDAPVAQGEPPLPAVPGKDIRQGVLLVGFGLMTGHIHRLVVDHHIFVLIEDRHPDLALQIVRRGVLHGH